MKNDDETQPEGRQRHRTTTTRIQFFDRNRSWPSLGIQVQTVMAASLIEVTPKG
jgi:hypothetical protein